MRHYQIRYLHCLVASTCISALGFVDCTSNNDSNEPGRGGSSGTSATGSGGKGSGGLGTSGPGGSSHLVGGTTGTGGSSIAGKAGSAGTNGWAAAGREASAGNATIAGSGAMTAAAGSGTAGVAGSNGNGPTSLRSILIGSFTPLTGYSAISGQTLMLRTSEGRTRVSIEVLGLQPTTAYPIHVHAAPCAQSAGGGHYKIDPTVTTTDATNELWLPVTSDASGVGIAEVEFSHLARGDAMSVVVHDPSQTGTPKMACADLGLASNAALVANGKLASFAQAEPSDQTIAGTVRLTRNSSGTQVEFNVTGLDPAATYASHVHALPCDVNAAGGHYKIDTTVTTTDEANELWLKLGDTSSGHTQGTQSFAHTARLDAQSVVIHRGTTKVACADLAITNFPSLSVSGTSTPFTAATDRGYAELAATGQLLRGLDGSTNVHLEVTGLKASSSYPAHVHNLPCAVQSGGGHYKLRSAETATLEANELWVNFATNTNGAAKTDLFAPHTARADARSIVIHDTDTTTRIACIDLGT